MASVRPVAGHSQRGRGPATGSRRLAAQDAVGPVIPSGRARLMGAGGLLSATGLAGAAGR